MKPLLLIFGFFAPLYVASALSSDGLTLLSLLKHWTVVPPSINSIWKASDSTPCSWLGVQCNRDSHVVSLNLTASRINGQLGLEIGNLNHLQTLVLLSNGFFGAIPPELGNCSQLKYIDLSENYFSGHIPYTLFQIPHLEEVYLYKNSLSGPIPSNIGNTTELLKLYLFSNQLSGPIPSSIGNCSRLEDLQLYFNHLTGEIPLGIWKIQSLEYILVHNNSLFGELPSEITELKHLKNISLFDNQFSGEIPQSLGINSKLVKLDLMNNKFTGKISPNLCFGKQLRVLNLGLNQLQGGIPPDVGKCATLGRLVLNKNNLTGSLPEFASNMNLIYIDISKNNISGTIPSSLGNCRNLTAIILSTNIITGLIPSELGNLVNLQALNLAHNNLEGPLPKKLSYCTKMERFDVGFNFLNGSFPSSLSSWTRINTLNLSENRFSGVIPAFLLEFEQIIELQIGGNMFEGNIPSTMVTRPNLLYELNLSANRLTGEVPPEIGMFIMLHTLDVSLNNLTGSINVFGELLSLTEVNISHNSFFGPVPEALKEYLSFSPSSFLGNPGLCVNCSASDDLSCTKTSYLKLKPCDLELEDHKGIVKRFIPLIVLLPLVFCSLVLGLLIVCKSPSVSIVREHRLIDLRYKWLVTKATENLNDGYIIGRGAHGIVYKAKLYCGVLAVKKLVIAESERKRLRMIKEIEIVRKTRHQNVATFLGSWIGKEYGLIFYKYMENGSLHDVLHENDPPTSLDWNLRYKIAVGIAKGLAYLHYICDPPILHRDIKPKNILLDSDMEPYITDFGISIALNQSSTVMHMRSTYHLGTRGFMAPEIAYTVVPSCEVDVYSYGVVLLELITRKKVLDSSFEEEGTTLVGWFKSVWRETREIEEIVDSSLAKELSDSNVVVQIIKVLLVALICTDTDPGKRLKMTDVIKFYEAPTIQGIFVEDDRTSFHLGNALAAAFISIPEVKTFRHRR